MLTTQFTFLDLLEVILGTIGLTIIVTQSKLLLPIRNLCLGINKGFGYLMQCPMCFGFYSGVIVYLLKYYNLDIVIYGFIGSFLSYLAYLLLSPLMDKYD